MAAAFLLEGLQAFTPDRTAYLPAIFYGAAGALAAALITELFIRVWPWRLNSEANVRQARSKSVAFTGSPNPV